MGATAAGVNRRRAQALKRNRGLRNGGTCERRQLHHRPNTVEIAYEARVYDLMEQLYPQYRKSAQLGRARMHVLYTFKYLLDKKVGRGIEQARKLSKIIANNPRALFFIFSAFCELFVCRVALLVFTGKLKR